MTRRAASEQDFKRKGARNSNKPPRWHTKWNEGGGHTPRGGTKWGRRKAYPLPSQVGLGENIQNMTTTDNPNPNPITLTAYNPKKISTTTHNNPITLTLTLTL